MYLELEGQVFAHYTSYSVDHVRGKAIRKVIDNDSVSGKTEKSS